MEKDKNKEKYFRRKKKVSSDDERNDKSKLSRGRSRTHVSTCNDPAWYAWSEEILRDTASIPFNSMAGLPMTIDTDPRSNARVVVPGIAVQDIHLALGTTEGANSYTNIAIAARNYYTYIRHSNSGSANYESPDLMMYLVAWASAAAYISHLKRGYSIMLTYSQRNRYLAESLAQSLGFSYEDWIRNLADFRTNLNIAIARLNTLAIPKDMSLIKRWTFLFSNIYQDDDGGQTQYYLYHLAGYFKIQVVEGHATSLLPILNLVEVDDAGNMVELFTPEEAINKLNQLIDGLLSEETFGIMSGDILKAYGDSIETIPQLEPDYFITPVHDVEVLNQFTNTFNYHVTELHEGGRLTVYIPSLNIYQEGGLIQSQIEYDFDSDLVELDDYNIVGVTGNNIILNMMDNDTSPGRVIVATRNIPVIEKLDSSVSTNTVRVASIGTELPCGLRVIYDVKKCSKPIFSVYSASEVGWLTLALAYIKPFYYAPTVYQVSGGEVVMHQNSHVYTAVSTDVIARMHNVAVLTELSQSAMNKVE